MNFFVVCCSLCFLLFIKLFVMDLKVYKSATNTLYSFLVKKEGKDDEGTVCVSFHGSNKQFQTRDPELQKLIEATRYFKEKKIVLARVYSGERAKEQKSSPVDYPDVMDINAAVEVLMRDFGCKDTQINTPAKIKKVSAEVGASFPNWVI